jgi:hypothetical protein
MYQAKLLIKDQKEELVVSHWFISIRTISLRQRFAEHFMPMLILCAKSLAFFSIRYDLWK